MLSVEPRIGRELFETERNTLLVFVVLQDFDLNLIANVDQVARMRLRPQDMSVMCKRPSIPPISTKAPYSVNS